MTKKITCPECKGEGEIEKNIPGDEDRVEADVMVTCWLCDGEGEIEDDADYTGEDE